MIDELIVELTNALALEIEVNYDPGDRGGLRAQLEVLNRAVDFCRRNGLPVAAHADAIVRQHPAVRSEH